MAWAAPFMCLHHTRPELMPRTELLVHGLFNPQELLQSVEKTAAKHGMTLEQYFPPYEIIRSTIELIRDGKLTVPTFTQGEIKGLELHTRFFAAADKLDSNHPPDLSAVRTFQTNPDRPFVIRPERNVSLEEELKMRIDRCDQGEAPDDFSRLVYEIKRTHAFDGVSPVLHAWYADALRGKGAFLDGAISALLDDDGSGFLFAYDHLEIDMTRAILTKAGYTRDVAISHVKKAIDSKHPEPYITNLLRDKGYAPDAYYSLLDRIEEERKEAAKIIYKKILSLHKMEIKPEEKVRIKALLSLAREQQDKELGYTPGSIYSGEFAPYDGYLYIHLTKLNPKK
jgi:hypothetical protein